MAATQPPRVSAAPAAEGLHRLEAMLEAAPDALMCVEPSGRIAMVNGRAGELFGFDIAELLGAPVEMLLPEELRSRHVVHREEFNRRPEMRALGLHAPLLARRRDGSVLPVEVSLVPWLTDEPGWVIAAVRDVTEQRALEAAVVESEGRLRTIAESLDLVSILLQLDPPAYLYVSPGAQRLMGITSKSLSEADVAGATRLVHPDDRAGVEEGFMWDAVAGLAASSEHRIVTEDGEERWVHALATPVLVPGGRVDRTVITVEDITDRVLVAETLHQAEVAARAASDAKNQFLSRMSHELRTPLNAVLGFGQLLERQLAGTEHAEAVDYVLKGGRHLLALINDVLDISRIESGQMSMSMESMPLAALVEESLQLMAPLAAAAEVTLAPASGDPEVLLLADRQRVRQILLNLLSNAIKYNKVGGEVWVSWRLDDTVVRLDVRDEGVGIALELQERLFQPFDRLGAELGEVEGAGIGLALTQSLAELMGGGVSVKSARGEGATFTVTLPAGSGVDPSSAHEIVPAVVPSAVAPAPWSVPAGTHTLLYVEDNEPNVHVVEHLLRLRPEWRLIHAALGGLGVELARAHHPDLVLLDLHLPDQPGRDVLRSLQRRDATKDIPVVVLSADASPGVAGRLVEAGAQRFLTKPLEVDVVLALLDATSGRPVDSDVPPDPPVHDD